jgi:hypothetical protein
MMSSKIKMFLICGQLFVVVVFVVVVVVVVVVFIDNLLLLFLLMMRVRLAGYFYSNDVN